MTKLAKFFNEAGGGHYDARFYNEKLEIAARQKKMLGLLDAFATAFDNIGVKPVLMHGALIGWHWNKRILPWDDDLDFCVEYNDLVKLDELLQLGSFHYDRKKYLFEINSDYKNRTTYNRTHSDCIEPNKIDARFIDKQTGLFIDITALSATDDGRLATKCPHIYQAYDLFPLQQSILENTKVYVPANVREILVQEYGAKVTYKKIFAGHFFDQYADRWLPVDKSVIDMCSRWRRWRSCSDLYGKPMFV